MTDYSDQKHLKQQAESQETQNHQQTQSHSRTNNKQQQVAESQTACHQQHCSHWRMRNREANIHSPLDMSPLWRHSAEDIRRWTGVYLHLEAEMEFSDWARGDVGPATYADDEEEAEAKAEQWQAIEGLAEDIHSFLPDLDRLTGLKAWVDAQNGPVKPEELLRWIFSHNREGWNLTLACYSGIKKGPSPKVTSLTREGWTGLMWAIGKNRKEAEDAAYRNLAKRYGLRRILRRQNPQAS